jgi:hypothetical protein
VIEIIKLITDDALRYCYKKEILWAENMVDGIKKDANGFSIKAIKAKLKLRKIYNLTETQFVSYACDAYTNR